MNPATTAATTRQQDTCVSTQKLVTTKQRRYQAKMKAARKLRRQEWERRKFAYQSLQFDGRVSLVAATGVPRLGEMELRSFL